MENTENIKKLIEILERVYEIEIENLNNKKNNLQKINVESLAHLIQSEKEKGNIHNGRDYVYYIDKLIQD